MIKRHVLAAFLVPLLCAAPVAADTISFDGNGGGDGFVNIDSLDWGAGNAIAIGANANSDAGTTFQLYYQANLDTAKLSNGTIQYVNNTGGGNDSLTLVVGFQESISTTSFDPNTNTGNFSFAFEPGGDNFFQIYANTDPGDNLSGACFVCGELIMSGTVNQTPFVSTFAALGDATADLDGAGSNDYDGILSLLGAGTVRLEADVTFADSGYFQGIPSTFEIVLGIANTNTNMPFTEVDPSACFFAATSTGGLTPTCTDSAANQTGVDPLTGVGSVGTVNAVNGDNTMFQADATASFETEAVPEPASLTLLGLGLMGSAYAARRRRNAAKK